MLKSTFAVTSLLSALVGAVAVVLFFPERAATVYNGLAGFIDPRGVGSVRLEYIAQDPERSRGWQTLRTFEGVDPCLASLNQDFSKLVNVVQPVGEVRCVSFNRKGERLGTVRARRLST